MNERAAAAATARPGEGPLAIVCGGGGLPLRIADAVAAQGGGVFMLAIRGAAGEEIERFPHAWIKLGELRLPLRLLEEHGCREVCIIGQVLRPRLSELELDSVSLRMLPRLARLWVGGDDKLLSGIARILEGDFGLKIVGAHEVAPDILAPAGPMSRRRPSAAELADVGTGFALLAALGSHDVGQAAVVAEGRVIAIEAAEGTDAMIDRVAQSSGRGAYRRSCRPGQGAKAGQDRRIDLPTIGSQNGRGCRARSAGRNRGHPGGHDRDGNRQRRGRGRRGEPVRRRRGGRRLERRMNMAAESRGACRSSISSPAKRRGIGSGRG